MQTVSQIMSIMDLSMQSNTLMSIDENGDVVVTEGRYNPDNTGNDALIAAKLQEAADREGLNVGQREATYRSKPTGEQEKVVKSFTLSKLGIDKPVRPAPPPPRDPSKPKMSLGEHGEFRAHSSYIRNVFDPEKYV